MKAPLYIAMYDLVQLEVRKVIIQPKSWRAVVYFYHPSMLDKVAFSASVSFYIKDSNKWHTGFVINAPENVIVNKMVESKLKDQLTTILSPYFSLLYSGKKPW
jgi:hypothetical protein